MKTGFTLIEVLVAAALASLVGTALFLSWGNVQKVAVRADNIISITDRIMLLQRQCEQDFMGICVPISRPYGKPPQEVTEEQEKFPVPADQKKEKPKIVPRVFYATTQADDNLELLTFLTDNPMQVYWSESAGGARPRIARVQYTLKKDESKKATVASYTLYRQEAYTLDIDRFAKESAQAVRSYELMKGIKSLKLTYWQEVHTKKEVKEDEKTITKIVKDVKKVSTWDLEKEEVLPKGIFIRPIPIMIKIELSVWDLQKKKSRSYASMIPIPIYIENPEEEQKKKKEKQPQAQSVLSKLPIPERLKQKDQQSPNAAGAQQPAAPVTTQVHTDVTIITDKGSLLKELLNEKSDNET